MALRNGELTKNELALYSLGFDDAIAELQKVHSLTIEELADYIHEEHPKALKGIKKFWADPNYQLTPLDKALIRMTLDDEQETN